jgi:hypothetical protein
MIGTWVSELPADTHNFYVGIAIVGCSIAHGYVCAANGIFGCN